MSNVGLVLNRDQLAKALGGNFSVIRAFELIAAYVDSEGPDAFAELASLVASALPKHNNSQIENRLLEQEGRTPRTPNLSDVMSRLEALEAKVQRLASMKQITDRVENLEKITGV